MVGHRWGAPIILWRVPWNPNWGCGESRNGGHIYGNMAAGPGWEVGGPVGVSVEVVGVVVAVCMVVAAGVIWGCGCRWKGATIRGVWDRTGGPGGG